jgi:hypothetical protein
MTVSIRMAAAGTWRPGRLCHRRAAEYPRLLNGLSRVIPDVAEGFKTVYTYAWFVGGHFRRRVRRHDEGKVAARAAGARLIFRIKETR